MLLKKSPPSLSLGFGVPKSAGVVCKEDLRIRNALCFVYCFPLLWWVVCTWNVSCWIFHVLSICAFPSYSITDYHAHIDKMLCLTVISADCLFLDAPHRALCSVEQCLPVVLGPKDIRLASTRARTIFGLAPAWWSLLSTKIRALWDF